MTCLIRGGGEGVGRVRGGGYNVCSESESIIWWSKSVPTIHVWFQYSILLFLMFSLC